MPLTQPSGGGLDIRALMNSRDWRVNSSGTDLGINFRSCFRDILNDRILIGGNSTFVGFKNKIADSGGITQSPVSPSTVITAGDIERIKPSSVDNGVLVKSGINTSEFARSPDSGATWFDIGAGLRALSYRDITSWKNGQLIAAARSATNLDISQDNGATWPVIASSQAIGSNLSEFLFTNPDEDILISLTLTGLEFCTVEDVTVPGNWNALDASVFGVGTGWHGGAVNDAGTKGCFISISGTIILTNDNFQTIFEFDRDLNPYVNGVGESGPPNWVTYWPAQDGFLMIGQNSTPATVFFIPADGGMTTGIVGYLFGSTGQPAFQGTNNQMCTDGLNCMLPNGSNLVFTTLSQR